MMKVEFLNGKQWKMAFISFSENDKSRFAKMQRIMAEVGWQIDADDSGLAGVCGVSDKNEFSRFMRDWCLVRRLTAKRRENGN